MNSDTDNGSLEGAFIDIALGSDLDGITDSELNGELEVLSDADDQKNVTVRERIRPAKKQNDNQRIPSVIVVPQETLRTMNDLLPKQVAKDRSRPSSSSENVKIANKFSGKGQNRKKFGVAKRATQQKGSLVDMLKRSNTKNNFDQKEKNVTPKRVRSPNDDVNNFASQDTQQAKRLNYSTSTPKTKDSKKVIHNPELQQQPASQPIPLELKVCLVNNGNPNRLDLNKIKKFLQDKIEEAILQRDFVPIVNDNVVKPDGVYVWCSDAPCAEWLYKVVRNKIPDLVSEVFVVPQSHVIPIVAPPTPSLRIIRTLVTVPTRKNNLQILEIFAQLNKQLNTEKWNIAHRRFKGAVNTVLFLRMDEHSFKQIANQNNELNWILGKVVVVIERKKPKSARGQLFSKESQMAGKPNAQPHS